MANAQPEGDLRALGLPWDTRAAIMDATSSGGVTEQAGPVPAPAEPNQATSLRVSTSGTVTTAEKVILTTRRGGGPEPAGGTFGYRHAFGEDIRDHDPPTAIAAWEWINRSTTTDKWRRPHAARLADGRLVVVASQDLDTVVAWVQGSNGLGLWSSVTIADTGYETCATVDVLPSGRICVWYTSQIATGTTQVHMQYSDDGGATFITGSARCLMTPIVSGADSIRRIRVRYVSGNAIMLAWYSAGGADYVWQFGSSDGGVSFYPVIEYEEADLGAPDIAIRGAEILVAWVAYDATLSGSSLIVPKVYRLGSVGTPFTSVEGVVAVSSAEAWEWGVYSGGRFTSAELAVLADDDGMIYCYGVDFDAAGTREVRVSRSYDGGDTWQTPLSAPDAVYYSGDTSTYLYDLAVVPEKGRAALLCRSAANPGTADDSLIAVWLGGWTTRGLPWLQGYPWDRYVMGWDVTYLPLDEPQNTSTTWTAVTVGAPVVTLGANGLTISQGAGEQKSWYYRPATGAGDSKGFVVQLQVTDISSGTAVVYLDISDATNHYRLRVTVSATQITVYDVNAAANVTSPTSITTNNRHVYVLIAFQHPSSDWTINNGHVRVSYRTESPAVSGPTADREWTAVAASTSMQTGVGTVNEIQWGCLANAAGVSFGSVLFAHGDSVLDDTVAQTGHPARGRTWCSDTSPAYVGRYGLRVSAGGGPCVIGDTWTIPAGYRYPVEALDPWRSPSPARKWRSTGEVQTDIIWTGLDKGIIAGDLIGFYIDGANFAQAELYQDTGGVTKIADIDLRLATGLGFTRTRGLIRPTGGAGIDAGLFLHEGMLSGCTWAYSAGGTARRIKWNTAGNFRGTGALTTYRPARIDLETYAAGDSASGIGGQIWSSRVLVVTDIATSTDELMLRVLAGTTPDGYQTAGIACPLRIALFSEHYSFGRSYDVETGVLLTETESGTRMAEMIRGARDGVEFAWVDGIVSNKAYQSVADFVTLGYGSAPPAGVRHADQHTQILGFLRSDSMLTPVLYVPAIPQQASAPTSSAPVRIADPHRLLFGRIVNEISSWTSTRGSEFGDSRGEVWRGNTIRIEQEK